GGGRRLARARQPPPRPQRPAGGRDRERPRELPGVVRAGALRDGAVKRAALLLFALAPALALGALGPRYGGELRVGVSALPASLEPGVAQAAGDRLVQGLVHETLLASSLDGMLRPALAAGWSSA